MATSIEICNIALDKLGALRISGFDQNTKESRACNLNYTNCRDQVMSEIPWTFAVKRATLAPDVDTPAWEFSYAYTLPADCLHLIELDGNPNYRKEGRKIYTDEGTSLNIKYIYRNENTSEYTPLFVNMLSTYLASTICESLTQDTTQRQLLMQEYMDAMDRAKGEDARNDPAQDIVEDDWVIAGY